jgi:hypothetical protein
MSVVLLFTRSPNHFAHVSFRARRKISLENRCELEREMDVCYGLSVFQTSLSNNYARALLPRAKKAWWGRGCLRRYLRSHFLARGVLVSSTPACGLPKNLTTTAVCFRLFKMSKGTWLCLPARKRSTLMSGEGVRESILSSPKHGFSFLLQLLSRRTGRLKRLGSVPTARRRVV